MATHRAPHTGPRGCLQPPARICSVDDPPADAARSAYPSPNPTVSKTDLRAEIEEQVRDYLRRGGAVAEVARGISGRDQAQGPAGRFHAFTPRPKEERTYVPEVVAAIEARRRKPRKSPPASARASCARRSSTTSANLCAGNGWSRKASKGFVSRSTTMKIGIIPVNVGYTSVDQIVAVAQAAEARASSRPGPSST